MTNPYAVKLALSAAAAPQVPRDRAVMWISVGGGRDFDGARLAAWMDWATDNFREVWVDVADTDKARNFETFDGYAPAHARQVAKTMGDLWLAANEETLHRVPPARITRFDRWTSDPSYQPARDALTALYSAQEPFRAAVDAEAASYAAKRTSAPLERHRAACRDYILDEIAACCVRAEALQAACLYPGAQKLPFALVRAYQMPGAPAQLALEAYAPVSIARRTRGTALRHG